MNLKKNGMIQIIDYGMGNIGSISNMLKKIGKKSRLVNLPEQLEDDQKIILPGVGAFDNAMIRLNESGFSKAIKTKAAAGTPLLGICLGMQLLGSRSEEGKLPGLNLIPGNIVRFEKKVGFKIPHMGWNRVHVRENALYRGLEENKFYFVHAYHFVPVEESAIIGETDYGIRFVSSVNKEQVYGAQFHPEKSHKYGMRLLKNYCENL